MKKSILPLFLLPILASAAVDPFGNSTWVNGNAAVSTHQHSLLPGGYNYSLAFTLPNGLRSSTDQCTVTGTTLRCSTGDVLTANAAQHSAVLQTQGSVYTYYERGYEPKGSPLSGDWHPVGDTTQCQFTHIKVPYVADKDAVKFDDIEFDVMGGFYFGSYALDYDTYSHQLFFGIQYGLTNKFYLYDSNGKQILDMAQLGTLAKLISAGYDKCTYVKG